MGEPSEEGALADWSSNIICNRKELMHAVLYAILQCPATSSLAEGSIDLDFTSSSIHAIDSIWNLVEHIATHIITATSLAT